jgi:hypothetical protein
MAENRTVTRHGQKGHLERVASYTKFVPEKYDTGSKKDKRK